MQPDTISGRGTDSARRRSRYVVSGLATLIGLRCIVSVAAGAGHYWDFVNFYNTGSRIFHGEWVNLFQPAAPIAGKAALGDGRMYYTGFPLSALMLAPLGAFPPRVALVLFKAAAAAAFALGLVLLYRHVARLRSAAEPPGYELAAYLLVILVFEPFWFVFRIGGQTTPFSFLLLVLFLRAYTADRPWSAAIWLSLATLNKPFIGAAVAIFALSRQWKLLARMTCCFAVAGALSIALFGWERHQEWLHVALQEAGRWAVPWWNNAAILAFINNFWLYPGDGDIGLRPAPASLALVQLGFKLLLFVLFVLFVSDVRRSGSSALEQRHHYSVLAMTFPLFFSTVVWPHYLAVLFIPVWLLATRWRELPRTAVLFIALIALSTVRASAWPVTSTLAHAVKMETTAGIMAIGLFASGTLILMCVFMILHGRRLWAPQRS